VPKLNLVFKFNLFFCCQLFPYGASYHFGIAGKSSGTLFFHVS